MDELGVDIRDVIVTVCDADSRLHPKYLSALTHGFVTNPSRRYAIWQPALMFYSNIWRIPAVARISAGLYSVWQLSRLVASYKLVTQSTYSLGLATCHAVGYWDVDVIPEDSRMFFKVFFALGHEHEVRVEPIFLPVLADAAEGPSFWSTIVSHYRQTRRWAWGVSDVPYVVRRAFERRAVPLWARLRRVGFYAEEHVCWPTHWFLLTIGANLVAYFAPATALAPSTVLLTTVSAWLLMLCLPCLGVVVVPGSAAATRSPRAADLVGPGVQPGGLAVHPGRRAGPDDAAGAGRAHAAPARASTCTTRSRRSCRPSGGTSRQAGRTAPPRLAQPDEGDGCWVSGLIGPHP